MEHKACYFNFSYVEEVKIYRYAIDKQYENGKVHNRDIKYD